MKNYVTFSQITFAYFYTLKLNVHETAQKINNFFMKVNKNKLYFLFPFLDYQIVQINFSLLYTDKKKSSETR